MTSIPPKVHHTRISTHESDGGHKHSHTLSLTNSYPLGDSVRMSTASHTPPHASSLLQHDLLPMTASLLFICLLPLPLNHGVPENRDCLPYWVE